MEERIDPHHRIEDWLSHVEPKTRELYKPCWEKFSAFCMARGKDPLRLVDDYREARYQGEREKDRFLDDWKDIIKGYTTMLEAKVDARTYAPCTVKNHLVAVKSFLTWWEIPLRVKLPLHTFTIYHNRDITREDIRLIISRATSRERAIYLMMAESGIRGGTALKLKYEHVREDFEKDIIPMRILTPAEILKGHLPGRFTFIGEDAARALREYLKPRLPLRDHDFVFASERPKTMARAGHEQITEASISVKFTRTARKLGLEKGAPMGKPGPIRLHSLRKYFRNNMRVDWGLREFWMGHTGLDVNHYLKQSVEEHRKEYAKAYEELRILEPSSHTGLKDIQEKLKQKDTEIQELRAQIQELRDSSEAMDDLMKTTGLLEKHKAEILAYLKKLINDVGKEDGSKAQV
jgi:hypothetical protein